MDQELKPGIIIIEPLGEGSRQWTRYRGWTVQILAELEHSAGLTVAQIADKLNQRKKAIREYCYRLYEAGCIEPIARWGWKITTHGQLLLYINNDHTNTTPTPQKDHTKTTLRQLTLSPFSDPDRSDPELAITNLIITHYNQTKQPFIFIEDWPELCEKLNYPPDEIEQALRKLYQDRVCYIYNNRKYGKRQLRLYQDFIERLKYV